MDKRQSIRGLKFTTKIILSILGISLVSVIVISAVTLSSLYGFAQYNQHANNQLGDRLYESSMEAMERQAKSFMTRAAVSLASECDALFIEAQRNIEAMAAFMQDLLRHPERLHYRLPLGAADPSAPPEMTIAVAPDVMMTPQLEAEMRLMAGAAFIFSQLNAGRPNLSNTYIISTTGVSLSWPDTQSYEPAFDPRTYPWFLDAIEADGIAWFEEGVDVYGTVRVTCAKAYTDQEGRVAGVVAMDAFTATYAENVLDRLLFIGETGFIFTIDEHGHYTVNTQIDDALYGYLNIFDTEHEEIKGLMLAGGTGVQMVEIGGTDYYIAFAPISTAGWSLGIAANHDEMFTGVSAMRHDVDEQTRLLLDYWAGLIRNTAIHLVILTIVLVNASVLLSIWISRSVTKPMTVLANGAIGVGQGDFYNKIDVRSNDEIGILTACFNRMIDDLSEYVTNLQIVTAEKERINSDLRIAADIQVSMLPKIIPPYSGREDFRLAALMQPAKEVGGDFYDFFYVDEAQTKIALVIADVSGKSMSAAMFMVISKVLLKDNKDLQCDEILGAVNELLCEGNDPGMFVTVFYSILDITTGIYTYACAGHNPPLLYRQATGGVSYLEVPKKNPPLGLFPGKKYEMRELVLNKGDTILLYTDGVTEAFSANAEMYGTKRLLTAMGEWVKEPSEAVVDSLYQDVKTFTGDEPQSDDITMLFFRYLGAANQ